MVNREFMEASKAAYKGILDYSEEAVVSLDIKGNTHSCIVDGTLTSVAGRLAKIIAWFDNKFGYTSRMIDWLSYWERIEGRIVTAGPGTTK